MKQFLSLTLLSFLDTSPLNYSRLTKILTLYYRTSFSDVVKGCSEKATTLNSYCLFCSDEAPKPTTALDYTFGRRAKTGHNIVSYC